MLAQHKQVLSTMEKATLIFSDEHTTISAMNNLDTPSSSKEPSKRNNKQATGQKCKRNH
jgi:hypothetical protein